MVGYNLDSKGYQIYDPITHEILVRRDIIFYENSVLHKSTETKNVKESTTKFYDLGSEEESEHEDSTPARPIQHSTIQHMGNVQGGMQLRRSTRPRNPTQKELESYALHIEIDEPLIVQKAFESTHAIDWKQAMDIEYESLIKNQTWELTSLPLGRRVVGCKWLFKQKYKSDGSIDHYKARLVAKGYTQIAGLDYHDTFSHIVKITSIRVLLAIAAALNFHVHQLDIKTTFLNGFLKEEIYMEQPEGYIQEGKEQLVCKLHKTLYGLKQSSRAWYERIDGFLQNEGYMSCNVDLNVYIKHVGELVIIYPYMLMTPSL
jgi:hypothetical protein